MLDSLRRCARPLPVITALVLAALPAGLPAQEFQLITAAGQKAMLSHPGVDPAGARRADVTIVEYFDYNCPYCKKLVPLFQKLLADDPDVAVLYKDWPILGAVSAYAARAAVAAKWQGKYLLAHDTLLGGPRLSHEDQVDMALQKAGVDLAELNRDRKRHEKEISAILARNDREANLLGLQGTPGIVVGRQLVSGAPEGDDLKKLVANARLKP